MGGVCRQDLKLRSLNSPIALSRPNAGSLLSFAYTSKVHEEPNDSISRICLTDYGVRLIGLNQAESNRWVHAA